MRKLLLCRRGVIGFATVIALIPMIAMLAVGTEVGGWYVVARHAQNAADAAAYAGGLRLACNLAAQNGVACSDAQSVAYRGKEFASKNAFCNAGDTGYPGSICRTPPFGTTQSVNIDIGVYSAGTWTSNGNGNYVKALVKQSEPTVFAKILGISTVTPGAQAIAWVQNPKGICGLGLGRTSPPSSAITLGGSATLAGGNCALISDNSAKVGNNLTFNGSGFAIDAVSGCISPCGALPSNVSTDYYSSLTTNPLDKLDTEPFNSTTSSTKACGGNVTNGSTCNLTAGAYGGNFTINNGGTVNLASGTYFFYNSNINVSGKISGSNVNIVLLGRSSLTINGGATVSLSACFSSCTYSDLAGVLIDDQAPAGSSNAVTVNGSAGSSCTPGVTTGCVALGGALYFPNVNVTWSGTAANTLTTCTEVVANTLTLGGGAYLSTSGCASGTVAQTQVVKLVL